MDLAQLLSQPALTISLGGKTYRFSELTLGAMASLQAWVKDHVPNPLAAVKEHLGGLPVELQKHLLTQARAEAANWPPQVGSPECNRILTSSVVGQIETLYHGLKVHQPDATVEDAEVLYRLMKQSGELATVTKVYRAIFGAPIDEDDDLGGGPPKGRGAAGSPSTGA